MQIHHRLGLILAGLALVLVALEALPIGRRLRFDRLVRWALAGTAAGNLLFVAFLWLQHARFPFTLDLMEFSMLQHVMRALEHRPIYAAAQPGFVPFAYNPLFYFAALPLVRLFGPGLFAVRLPAILGALGATLVLYGVVSGRTGSRGWGLAAAGLFAAAYQAMDSSLDMAHVDSLMICFVLLGAWSIDRHRSRLGDWTGLLLLIAAFWFKQHGAVFALGGALYLTWRDGWRRSWGYWTALLLLGPALYAFAGPSLLGPEFHFYTWDVPRHWSRLDAGTFLRMATFFGRGYAVLLVAAVYLCLRREPPGRPRWSAWQFLLPFAVLTAFQGALDADSSDNVFAPLGTWAILAGTLGLHAYGAGPGPAHRPRLGRLALLLAFAALAYDPRDVLVPPRAQEKLTELVRLLDALPGSTFAPDIGPLPGGRPLVPAAHWIALDDLMRAHARDSLIVESVLDPAIHPRGGAWLLTYRRLDTYACLRSLRPCYVLDTDFGDRFRALQPLPRRFPVGWPRFLYRYDPAGAAAQARPGPARAEPARPPALRGAPPRRS